jgi:hypothetical protein
MSINLCKKVVRGPIADFVSTSKDRLKCFAYSEIRTGEHVMAA